MNTRFKVKIADTELERLGALSLRHRVFAAELGATSTNGEHETDGFDGVADHLVLIDTEANVSKNRIIGTTRVLAEAGAPQGLYTAQSFDLSAVLASGLRVIEVGRLCIAPAHRNGLALAQLFEGLRDYVVFAGGEVLVGTASFRGTDISEIENSIALLNTQYALETWHVTATGQGAVDTQQFQVTDRVSAVATLPSALKSYLRMGGRVGAGAVIDIPFNTIDVCVVLEVAKMTHRLAQGRRP